MEFETEIWLSNNNEILTRNDDDSHIGFTIEAGLTSIESRVFQVNGRNGQGGDQCHFLKVEQKIRS